MLPRVFSRLKKLLPDLDAGKHEITKLILLSSCFFLIIGSFSIIKPLKQSVFNAIVGVDYQPYTRFITLIMLVPLMLLYSKMVDKLRRYQLLVWFMLFYGISGLLLAYFLWHPIHGLSNTVASKWRMLGWAFYVYGDFFQIFVVSSFWAFSNSISKPDYAKKNYGLIVAASKLGGVLTPLLTTYALANLSFAKNDLLTITMIFASFLLFGSALIIKTVKKVIPGHMLHGYEAVYKLEKQKGKKKIKTGVFEGIRLMLTQPYVFGIFGLMYGYEVISAIVDYQMQVLVKLRYHGNPADMFVFFSNYTAAFQALGFVFALIGTGPLLKRFDVKACLIIAPAITAATLVGLFMYPSLLMVTATMIIFRAMNYGFNVPVREILFIPTVKDIKFKSKAWVESFGKSFSKTSGSTFNIFSLGTSLHARVASGSIFSLGLTVAWAIVALLVGRKYTKTIKSGGIIGSSSKLEEVESA